MIRVPVLGIHAPWPVLLAAAVLMVLMLAAAGAALILWPLPLELTAAWSRLRRSLAAAVTVAGALALTARQAMRPPPWLRARMQAWLMRRRVKRIMADADWWWRQGAGLWSAGERRHFARLLASNDKRAGRP